MKCEICGKPIKENTAGNARYCQGHDFFEIEMHKEKRAKADKK